MIGEVKEKLIPSVRSWASIVPIIVAPSVLWIMGVAISPDNQAAMEAFWWGLGVLVLFSIVGKGLRYEVVHVQKDGMIHSAVIFASLLRYLTFGAGTFRGIINISMLYMTFHIFAHICDMIVPKKTRFRSVVVFVAAFIIACMILNVAYTVFNFNVESVL